MSTIIFASTLTTEICVACGVQFAMPQELNQRFRDTHKSFTCPNGHSQHYPQKSNAEILRDELKRKEQELANIVAEKLAAIHQVQTLNKKLKRVHNGTCPCCKRSFANLQKHMLTKHPELVKK